MSQNYFSYDVWSGEILSRKVLYGYDAPTGGFFFAEFYNQKELRGDDEADYVRGKDELTLTELVHWLDLWYDFKANVEMLISQLSQSEYPTPLQIKVGTMFGKDVSANLVKVMSDLQENFREYFVK